MNPFSFPFPFPFHAAGVKPELAAENGFNSYVRVALKMIEVKWAGWLATGDPTKPFRTPPQ